MLNCYARLRYARLRATAIRPRRPRPERDRRPEHGRLLETRGDVGGYASRARRSAPRSHAVKPPCPETSLTMGPPNMRSQSFSPGELRRGKRRRDAPGGYPPVTLSPRWDEASNPNLDELEPKDSHPTETRRGRTRVRTSRSRLLARAGPRETRSRRRAR